MKVDSKDLKTKICPWDAQGGRKVRLSVLILYLPSILVYDGNERTCPTLLPHALVNADHLSVTNAIRHSQL